MLDGYLATMGELLKAMRRHVPGLCLRSLVMLPTDVTAEDRASAERVEFIHMPMQGRPQ